ncbi:MAG TPA: hypothetical protein VF228_10195 [Iamia sp.]
MPILALALLLMVTALEVLDQVDVLLGIVVPVIVAYVVRSTADARTKQWVTLGVVALVTVLSLLTEDWSAITPELVARRAMLLAGEAQVTYVAVSAAVQRWTGACSMNDLEVFAPDRGIGPAGHEPCLSRGDAETFSPGRADEPSDLGPWM